MRMLRTLPGALGIGLLVVGLVSLGNLQLANAQQGAEAELKTLQVPDDFEIGLFASEPLITNPAAIDIDTHGRVWVAEIQWYRSKAKQPPADKIKVLEDTDGDGKADKVTVFAEGVFAPMSICVAGSKVYVATSPDLWVYEDKNGDLKADGPPTKLLTGFGGFNHDHSAHSLVLGPDHKWWMAHGDGGLKVTGVDGGKIESRWGAMIRGELDGTKLEAVATNFRNPYEIAVSSYGEAYCSDNDNDGNFSVRICWILEGGDYGWFGNPGPKVLKDIPFSEGWHFRAHTPGFVPGTLVTGFGSPTGMCFYEGDAFGPKYKDAPLHTDCGPAEVRVYRHTKAGAGMTATSETFLKSSGDKFFRPDDICTAPDGSLYVADWYDGGVGGHAYNNPDQGRIFRLTPKGKKLTRREKPGPYESLDDATVALHSPNLATQFLARERLIAGGSESIEKVIHQFENSDDDAKARALWLLDRIGGAGREYVAKQLSNSDGKWRALAVRILRRHGEPHAPAILALANDTDGEVVREVLLAIRKLDSSAADEALLSVIKRFDGKDRYLLEAIHVAAAPRKDKILAAIKSAQGSAGQLSVLQVLDPAAASVAMLSALSAVTSEDQRLQLLNQLSLTPSAEACRAIVTLAADKNATEAARRRAVELVGANLKGTWQAFKGDEQVGAALQKLLADPATQALILNAAADAGLNSLGNDILALASSDQASVETRAKAMATAAQLRVKGAAKILEQSLASSDAKLRSAAIASLVDLQDWPALKKLLNDTAVDAATRSEVAERTMNSVGGALVLLKWLDEKTISGALAAQLIAKATKHPDANIRLLYEKFIPEDQRPKRLGAAIQASEILALAGDAARGEKIFFQSSAAQCKNCHRVQGQGGQTGPDLSAIGKKYERATLLETILDPSKAIAPEYVPYLVQTTDGLVYAGFIVQRNEREVVLKDIQNKQIRLKTKDVETIEEQKKSLMPELVLRDVTAQDAADLLAYMLTLTQTK